MPLPKQDLTFSFGFGGTEQKTDEKVLPLGSPKELANIRSPRTGVIAKRYGIEPATTDTVDGSIGELKRIMGIGQKLLATTLSATGVRNWKTLGLASNGDPLASSLIDAGELDPDEKVTQPAVPRAWVDDQGIGVDASGLVFVVDMAIGQSQTCYAYEDGDAASGKVGVSIVDSKTGAVLYKNSQVVAAGTGARKHYVYAVPSSNTFVVVATGYLLGAVSVRLVSTAGVLATTDVDVLINANHAWDATMIGNTLIIAYRTAAATTLGVSKYTVTSTSLGSVSTSAAIAMFAGPVNVAVAEPRSDADTTVVILINEASFGLTGVSVTLSSLAVSTAQWVINATIRTSATSQPGMGVRLSHEMSVSMTIDAA